jgi:hypothetical protein
MAMIGLALLALTIVPVYLITLVVFNAKTIGSIIKRVFFTLLISAIIILIIAGVFLTPIINSAFKSIADEDAPAIENTRVANPIECRVDKMGIKRCPDGHYEY